MDMCLGMPMGMGMGMGMGMDMDMDMPMVDGHGHARAHAHVHGAVLVRGFSRTAYTCVVFCFPDEAQPWPLCQSELDPGNRLLATRACGLKLRPIDCVEHHKISVPHFLVMQLSQQLLGWRDR